jgi:hypothetical protein
LKLLLQRLDDCMSPRRYDRTDNWAENKRLDWKGTVDLASVMEFQDDVECGLH